jgi:GNAT superfamily N-acetyltransferase
LSPETIRLRFFASHPRLTPAEVEWFTHLDYDRRVALVAVLSGDLVAVGRFEGAPDTDVAEVAFVVEDAHQDRGLGSVLLEHLAAIAAERGIRRFEANVLAENFRMLRVFRDAGFQAISTYDQDVVHLIFSI